MFKLSPLEDKVVLALTNKAEVSIIQLHFQRNSTRLLILSNKFNQFIFPSWNVSLICKNCQNNIHDSVAENNYQCSRWHVSACKDLGAIKSGVGRYNKWGRADIHSNVCLTTGRSSPETGTRPYIVVQVHKRKLPTSTEFTMNSIKV